jgi:2-acylglycerol O-acyltransferase 2
MIVGRPISVKKHDKPTTEEVRQVQEKYITELTRCVFNFFFPLCFSSCGIELFISIWDTYKDEFAKARLRELEIVE